MEIANPKPMGNIYNKLGDKVSPQTPKLKQGGTNHQSQDLHAIRVCVGARRWKHRGGCLKGLTTEEPQKLVRIHWKVGWPVWKEQLRLGGDLTSPVLGECLGDMVKGLEGLRAIQPLRTLKSDLPGLPDRIEKLPGVESELTGIGKKDLSRPKQRRIEPWNPRKQPCF